MDWSEENLGKVGLKMKKMDHIFSFEVGVM